MRPGPSRPWKKQGHFQAGAWERGKLDIYIPPLLEIESEIAALDYHLDLIESQIKNKEAFERVLFQKEIKKRSLSHDDPEWHEEKYQLDYIVEFLLPRLFRAPFLVSLYAVYESAVTEIATLIQNKKGTTISIKDQKGKNFIDKAKKYYKNIIDFQLCSNKLTWDRITMLLVLRHAIAHANGRIEMLKPKTRQQIMTWENQNIGISSISGFIMVEEDFLRHTFSLVSDCLNDLVRRYEKWHDNQTSL